MPLLTQRHPGFARTLELSESRPHPQGLPRPESPAPFFPNYTAAVTGPLNLNLECKSSITEGRGRVRQTLSSLGHDAPHCARLNFLLKLFCSITLLSAWLPGRSGLCGGGGPESPCHVLVHPEVRQGEPSTAVPGAPAAIALAPQGSSPRIGPPGFALASVCSQESWSPRGTDSELFL